MTEATETENETQEEEEEQPENTNRTMYEIIRDVVVENPVATSLVALIIIAILVFGAVNRWRHNHKEK